MVVHPQSIVHSMVELVDGSVLAQLGTADMRLAIQYAFSYPDRWPSPVPRLDLTALGRLDFHPPDREAFPCLGLAYRALDAEGSLPTVLNAANEVAVEAFLAGTARVHRNPAAHRAHDGRPTFRGRSAAWRTSAKSTDGPAPAPPGPCAG